MLCKLIYWPFLEGGIFIAFYKIHLYIVRVHCLGFFEQRFYFTVKLVNSADPDEMLHFVASYLGQHCQSTTVLISCI